MLQYKTEAIVLRLREYREADALVTLLTKERGKVSGVAKSVYKPSSKLRGGVQPYSVNDMMLSQGRGSLHTLIQSECVEMLLPIRHCFEAMALGAYWAELLESFGQEELPDDELYLLGKTGFMGIAVDPRPVMRLVLEMRLISQQGIRPDFSTCCKCGKGMNHDQLTCFAPADGGFLCGDCTTAADGSVKVSKAVAGLWQGLEKMSLDKLKRVELADYQARELGNVLYRWLLRHTDRPLKSRAILDNMEV